MGMHDQFGPDGIVLDNAMAYWIHRVYQATRNASFRAFREDTGEDVTPEQWIVLVRLWQEDGQTQTEIGAATYRDRPTMSRILSGMERRGWVERRADESNQRIWRIHLTPAGAALRRALVPKAQALVAQSLRGISKSDLVTTRETLKKMFANLDGG